MEAATSANPSRSAQPATVSRSRKRSSRTWPTVLAYLGADLDLRLLKFGLDLGAELRDAMVEQGRGGGTNQFTTVPIDEQVLLLDADRKVLCFGHDIPLFGRAARPARAQDGRWYSTIFGLTTAIRGPSSEWGLISATRHRYKPRCTRYLTIAARPPPRARDTGPVSVDGPRWPQRHDSSGRTSLLVRLDTRGTLS